MKRPQGKTVVIAFVVITFVICSAFVLQRLEANRSTARFPTALTSLVIAAQGYCRDHVSTKQAFPSTVSLQTLVESGYISARDVRAFDGMNVTIFPTDVDTYPQSKLIDVQLRDGRLVIALADGSIR